MPFFAPTRTSSRSAQTLAPAAALVLFAHRGAPREACENTLLSFALALEAGADVLELDLRATRDGHLVVLHDDDLHRVGGTRAKVGELTLAQVQRVALRSPARGTLACGPNGSTVPTFRQFLARYPEANANVDLKEADPRWAEALLEELRAARATGGARGRYVLTSFVDAQLTALQRGAGDNVALGVGRKGCLLLLASAYVGLPRLAHLRGRVVQVPVQHHVCGRAVPVVTDRFIARVKALGCALHVWWDESTMVDDPEQARALYARGVDGVFTNDVRRLARALRSAPAGSANNAP